MTVAKPLTPCPYCREPIRAGATRCRYCHADLTSYHKAKKSFLSRYNDFRHGFLAGVLFVLVILVLIYLQFFVSR
jgi:hypothetical protein